MRRLSIITLAALAGTLAGVPASHGDAHSAITQVVDALSGIDFLPDATSLDSILHGDIATLVEVANTVDDDGVRLRAYRALGLFDSDVARDGLNAAIVRYRTAQSGTELLDLIAAVEALGEIGGAPAVPVLSPFLDADSRDLRAASARALGATRVAAACTPLRARQSHEPTSQVHIAIDDALGMLGALCGPS